MMVDPIRDLIIPFLALIVSAGAGYFGATFAIGREKSHGKALLLEICRRYVFNVMNIIDGKEFKADHLSNTLYLSELSHIVDNMSGLLQNIYLEELILKYPLVTKALFITRRELVERGLTSSPALNADTLDQILMLRRVVLKDLGAKIGNSEMEQKIDEFELYLRQEKIIPSS